MCYFPCISPRETFRWSLQEGMKTECDYKPKRFWLAKANTASHLLCLLTAFTS